MATQRLQEHDFEAMTASSLMHHANIQNAEEAEFYQARRREIERRSALMSMRTMNWTQTKTPANSIGVALQSLAHFDALHHGIRVLKVTTRGKLRPRTLTISPDRFSLFITHQPISANSASTKKKSGSSRRSNKKRENSSNSAWGGDDSDRDDLRSQNTSASNLGSSSNVLSCINSSILGVPFISRKGMLGVHSNLRDRYVRTIDVADLNGLVVGVVATQKLELARHKNRLTGVDSHIDSMRDQIVTILHHGDQTLDVLVPDPYQRLNLMECLRQMRQTYHNMKHFVGHEALLIRYWWYDIDLNRDGKINSTEFQKLLHHINFPVPHVEEEFKKFVQEVARNPVHPPTTSPPPNRHRLSRRGSILRNLGSSTRHLFQSLYLHQTSSLTFLETMTLLQRLKRKYSVSSGLSVGGPVRNIIKHKSTALKQPKSISSAGLNSHNSGASLAGGLSIHSTRPNMVDSHQWIVDSLWEEYFGADKDTVKAHVFLTEFLHLVQEMTHMTLLDAQHLLTTLGTVELNHYEGDPLDATLGEELTRARFELYLFDSLNSAFDPYALNGDFIVHNLYQANQAKKKEEKRGGKTAAATATAAAATSGGGESVAPSEGETLSTAFTAAPDSAGTSDPARSSTNQTDTTISTDATVASSTATTTNMNTTANPNMYSANLTEPISRYWINTSHNTYLTGDQLRSASSVEMYLRALQRGCKCLEIDVWDGDHHSSTGEPLPVVYHGHTLTSKILFLDILRCVQSYVTSNPQTYPIILSLENHCSHPYQETMAKDLQEVFGDILYIPDNDGPRYDPLPSPEDLRGKVVIKGKRPPDPDDEDSIPDRNEGNLYDDDEEHHNSNGPSSPGRPSALESSVGVLPGEEKEKDKRHHSSVMTSFDSFAIGSGGISGGSGSGKKSKIVPALKRLTLFHGSKYKNFEHSISEPTDFMHSIGETKIQKILSKKGASVMQWKEFNTTHLTRTYPAGRRVDSSNYNPTLAWAVGCQMVALNVQTWDNSVVINDGRFRENHRVGYILKPKSTMHLRPQLRNQYSSMEEIQAEHDDDDDDLQDVIPRTEAIMVGEALDSVIESFEDFVCGDSTKKVKANKNPAQIPSADSGDSQNEAARIKENRRNSALIAERMKIFRQHMTNRVNPMRIRMRVLAGSCLPKPDGARAGESIDPYVLVTLHDTKIGKDGRLVYISANFSTRSVRDNGYCPVWKEREYKELTVVNPEVAILQFSVKDRDAGIDDRVGEAAIPCNRLRCGIRSIQIFDTNNTRTGPFGFAAVLVEIRII